MWIEIEKLQVLFRCLQSLPTRECGLKFVKCQKWSEQVLVTPYAGVWIEILRNLNVTKRTCVTPYAGVWIEINKHLDIQDSCIVTPYAGVWIEIAIYY